MQIWAAAWENVPPSICTQRSLKQAYASAQFYQSLQCLLEDTVHPWLSRMGPVKGLMRLHECACWFDPRWTHMSDGSFSDVSDVRDTLTGVATITLICSPSEKGFTLKGSSMFISVRDKKSICCSCIPENTSIQLKTYCHQCIIWFTEDNRRINIINYCIYTRQLVKLVSKILLLTIILAVLKMLQFET